MIRTREETFGYYTWDDVTDLDSMQHGDLVLLENTMSICVVSKTVKGIHLIEADITPDYDLVIPYEVCAHLEDPILFYRELLPNYKVVLDTRVSHDS